MKLSIYFCLFLLLIFTDCKNGNKEIECTLISGPGPITGCGVFSFTYAMKFQKSSNKTEFIGLLFCPDFYGKDFFQVGQKYIVLTTDTTNIKADITVNEYKGENLPIYGIEKMVFKK